MAICCEKCDCIIRSSLHHKISHPLESLKELPIWQTFKDCKDSLTINRTCVDTKQDYRIIDCRKKYSKYYDKRNILKEVAFSCICKKQLNKLISFKHGSMMISSRQTKLLMRNFTTIVLCLCILIVPDQSMIASTSKTNRQMTWQAALVPTTNNNDVTLIRNNRIYPYSTSLAARRSNYSNNTTRLMETQHNAKKNNLNDSDDAMIAISSSQISLITSQDDDLSGQQEHYRQSPPMRERSNDEIMSSEAPMMETGRESSQTSHSWVQNKNQNSSNNDVLFDDSLENNSGNESNQTSPMSSSPNNNYQLRSTAVGDISNVAAENRKQQKQDNNSKMPVDETGVTIDTDPTKSMYDNRMNTQFLPVASNFKLMEQPETTSIDDISTTSARATMPRDNTDISKSLQPTTITQQNSSVRTNTGRHSLLHQANNNDNNIDGDNKSDHHIVSSSTAPSRHQQIGGSNSFSLPQQGPKRRIRIKRPDKMTRRNENAIAYNYQTSDEQYPSMLSNQFLITGDNRQIGSASDQQQQPANALYSDRVGSVIQSIEKQFYQQSATPSNYYSTNIGLDLPMLSQHHQSNQFYNNQPDQASVKVIRNNQQFMQSGKRKPLESIEERVRVRQILDRQRPRKKQKLTSQQQFQQKQQQQQQFYGNSAAYSEQPQIVTRPYPLRNAIQLNGRSPSSLVNHHQHYATTIPERLQFNDDQYQYNIVPITNGNDNYPMTDFAVSSLPKARRLRRHRPSSSIALPLTIPAIPASTSGHIQDAYTNNGLAPIKPAAGFIPVVAVSVTQTSPAPDQNSGAQTETNSGDFDPTNDQQDDLDKRTGLYNNNTSTSSSLSNERHYSSIKEDNRDLLNNQIKQPQLQHDYRAQQSINNVPHRTIKSAVFGYVTSTGAPSIVSEPAQLNLLHQTDGVYHSNEPARHQEQTSNYILSGASDSNQDNIAVTTAQQQQQQQQIPALQIEDYMHPFGTIQQQQQPATLDFDRMSILMKQQQQPAPQLSRQQQKISNSQQPMLYHYTNDIYHPFAIGGDHQTPYMKRRSLATLSGNTNHGNNKRRLLSGAKYPQHSINYNHESSLNKKRSGGSEFFSNAGHLLMAAIPLLLAPALGFMFLHPVSGASNMTMSPSSHSFHYVDPTTDFNPYSNRSYDPSMSSSTRPPLAIVKSLFDHDNILAQADIVDDTTTVVPPAMRSVSSFANYNETDYNHTFSNDDDNTTNTAIHSSVSQLNSNVNQNNNSNNNNNNNNNNSTDILQSNTDSQQNQQDAWPTLPVAIASSSGYFASHGTHTHDLTSPVMSSSVNGINEATGPLYKDRKNATNVTYSINGQSLNETNSSTVKLNDRRKRDTGKSDDATTKSDGNHKDVSHKSNEQLSDQQQHTNDEHEFRESKQIAQSIGDDVLTGDASGKRSSHIITTMITQIDGSDGQDGGNQNNQLNLKQKQRNNLMKKQHLSLPTYDMIEDRIDYVGDNRRPSELDNNKMDGNYSDGKLNQNARDTKRSSRRSVMSPQQSVAAADTTVPVDKSLLSTTQKPELVPIKLSTSGSSVVLDEATRKALVKLSNLLVKNESQSSINNDSQDSSEYDLNVNSTSDYDSTNNNDTNSVEKTAIIAKQQYQRNHNSPDLHNKRDYDQPRRNQHKNNNRTSGSNNFNKRANERTASGGRSESKLDVKKIEFNEDSDIVVAGHSVHNKPFNKRQPNNTQLDDQEDDEVSNDDESMLSGINRKYNSNDLSYSNKKVINNNNNKIKKKKSSRAKYSQIREQENLLPESNYDNNNYKDEEDQRNQRSLTRSINYDNNYNNMIDVNNNNSNSMNENSNNHYDNGHDYNEITNDNDKTLTDNRNNRDRNRKDNNRYNGFNKYNVLNNQSYDNNNNSSNNDPWSPTDDVDRLYQKSNRHQQQNYKPRPSQSSRNKDITASSGYYMAKSHSPKQRNSDADVNLIAQRSRGESKVVNDYLKHIQFSDQDRDKLMASYLTCDGLLDGNDHCLERLSCEFSDKVNINKANRLDRAVSSILLGHILVNSYIPQSFKLRLKSASLYGYSQSGGCSKYQCNKLTQT